MSFSVPLAGYNSTPLPLPALDFENAQEITLTADVETEISLSAGIYQVICLDDDFDFAHAPDLTGITIRAPWFSSVWLSIYVDRATKLAVKSVAGGTLKIFPARRS